MKGMHWIRACLKYAVICRATALLLALGLTLVPVLTASHGWAAMSGADHSAHHHKVSGGQAMDHGNVMDVKNDPGCCFLSIFCGALDLAVDAFYLYGPQTASPDHSFPTVRHQDGIGQIADPPPPRS